MNPRYQKGRRGEWRSRDLLQQQGYFVVRAAGSKGAFDLVAFNGFECLLIQCKSNGWPSPAAREALLHVPVPAGVRKLVHRWDTGQGSPHVREIGALDWRQAPRVTKIVPQRGVIEHP